MNQFVPKARPMLAHRVGNIVPEWIVAEMKKGYVRQVNGGMLVQTDHGVVLCPIGDWVLRDEHPEPRPPPAFDLKVCKAHEFLMWYERKAG